MRAPALLDTRSGTAAAACRPSPGTAVAARRTSTPAEAHLSCDAASSGARPAAAPVLWATPGVAHWNARWCASAAAVLDLRLPPLLPCMPRLSYPAAPPPALPVPSRASELLTTAAAHHTFVELTQLCLEVQQQLMEEQVEEQMEEDDQQQLADLMEEQMTGEDAVDIAISLGMPH